MAAGLASNYMPVNNGGATYPNFIVINTGLAGSGGNITLNSIPNNYNVCFKYK